MQFLGAIPASRLAENGTKHYCFAAELFDVRPAWAAMASYKPMVAALEQSIKKLAARAACPFVQLGIYVDEQGAWLLATSKKEMQLGHARSALGTLLEPMDAYEHDTPPKSRSRKNMERSVRPFDELDLVRLATWKTTATLRPKFPKVDVEEPASSDDEGPSPPRSEGVKGPSVQQLLAEVSDSEEERDAPQALALMDSGPQVLALTDSAPQAVGRLALHREAHTYLCETWIASAERQAVVVLLSVGEPLRELSYIHCHWEERRVALLVSRLVELPDLVDTVTIAMQMAREGSLPSPMGPRARKSEFMKRCDAALLRRNPLAQRDVRNLSLDDQRKIALALDCSKHLCSRCPAPASTSMEFSLAWLDGIPAPDPDTRWFCAACKPSHPAVCLKCGKHGSLVRDGDAPLQTVAPQVLGFHMIRGLRCQDCKGRAVAPLNRGEKRRLEGDLRVDAAKIARCLHE